MQDTIICPNCQKSIPLTEALSHQIQEKYQKFYKIRLAEEKAKLEEKLQTEISQKITAELELKFKDKANEAAELKLQNQKLQQQFLDINRLVRQLQNEKDQLKIDSEKRLREEEEKIRLREKTRVDEEYKFKLLEKDKKLDDALKMVDEYKRKLEQGSQQLQGEVLELELENMLKSQFPADDIKPVGKGIRGADMIQTVRASNGKVCGTIIWETKRTKAWSGDWIGKLKEDQREAKAEIAVLISNILPPNLKSFELINGVWVGGFDNFLSLAMVLRTLLLEVASVKNSNINRQNKMEVLYNYFTGIEFKHRLEAVVETYNNLQIDLEKEKRYFSVKWARQEKYIRSVFDNLSGMYGDLQSMVGKALPDVKGLNMLPDGEKSEKNDTLF